MAQNNYKGKLTTEGGDGAFVLGVGVDGDVGAREGDAAVMHLLCAVKANHVAPDWLVGQEGEANGQLLVGVVADPSRSVDIEEEDHLKADIDLSSLLYN